ncbi:hypothetical protein GAY30_15215, partial [Azospirillum brasilense]|nr:hypothetical protein [Azospirillum brasilense]
MPQPPSVPSEPPTFNITPCDRDILDVEPMLRNFGGPGPTVTMLYTLFLENADELSRVLKERLALGDLHGVRLAAHSAAGA